ncbi:MAG: DNA polymerase III subunit delta' [Pseudomonadota bacterium]
MIPGEYFPWHAAHRERLVAMQRRDKLPHALLLAGPRNLGKRAFASAFAAGLLCRLPEAGAACGDCDNCKLVAAGTHPDFRIVAPEDSQLIVIRQIRDFIEWSAQTAQRGGMRVALVYPAEQMNIASANALLKCLEEPGDRTLIMLVTDLPGRLLPTIRSRCQLVDFAIPPRRQALDWLRSRHPGINNPELLLGIGGGAPLAVTTDFDEVYMARREAIGQIVRGLVNEAAPLELARTLVAADLGLDLKIIYGLFADALRYQLAGDESLIKNMDLMDLIRKVAARLPARQLLLILDALTRGRRAVAGPSNPNLQLLAEALMVELADYCAL